MLYRCFVSLCNRSHQMTTTKMKTETNFLKDYFLSLLRHTHSVSRYSGLHSLFRCRFHFFSSASAMGFFCGSSSSRSFVAIEMGNGLMTSELWYHFQHRCALFRFETKNNIFSTVITHLLCKIKISQ